MTRRASPWSDNIYHDWIVRRLHGRDEMGSKRTLMEEVRSELLIDPPSVIQNDLRE